MGLSDMLQQLIIYLLVCLLTLEAAGQAPPERNVPSVRLKALPNPFIIPWANAQYYCTKSTAWVTPIFDPNDCVGAIDKFHAIEVAPKRTTVYEYIQGGTQQSHPTYYGQALPRRYSYGTHHDLSASAAPRTDSQQGTCTVAIINMNDTNLGNVRRSLAGRTLD